MHTGLFEDLTVERLLGTFTGFEKASQGTVATLGPGGLAPQQAALTVHNHNDYAGGNSWVVDDITGCTLQGMVSFSLCGGLATGTAKTVVLLPLEQLDRTAGQGELFIGESAQQ